MAVTPNSVVSVQTPQNGLVQIVNADGTANKTVFTAGANGSKITGLLLQSDDTAGKDVRVSIVRSGTTYPLGCVTVPLGAGNSGSVPSVNALNSSQLPGIPVDSDGNPYLLLKSGDTLVVNALTAVTAAKTITATVCAAGDF